MQFLVVGLGSMGKRRIRNLQYLEAGEIAGFDPRADRCQEASERYKIKTFTNFDEAMGVNPDALIISTPPDLHMPYARIAAERGKHFFTEASVVDDGMAEVMALAAQKPIVAAPSCTMRFHPSVRVIKELVDSQVIGPVLSFTHHCGQYLPDWHPWEDYRTFYVAKRATGACREIVPFELVWLLWVLGDVDLVSGFKGKLTQLDVDIDDVYQMLLRLKQGALGHLLVDVVARVPYRVCRLLSEQGVIEWNSSEKKVRLYQSATESWTEYPEPEAITQEGYIAAENMYIEEMKCFTQAIQGQGTYPYTFAEDQRILDLLYAAEKSAESQTHVSV